MASSVSFVLPCLNEEMTIAICIEKARKSLAGGQFDHEVVVVDNGSTDQSVEIAIDAGARVVRCAQRGYGAAIRCGVLSARGEYILVADADDSYALHDLEPFVAALEAGADMVLGDRFAGGVDADAMPWLNRYVGNPFLTGMLNILFGARIGDAHCGLRGFRKSAFQYMSPQSDGMEFASETVVLALRLGFDLEQIPTTLKKDGRDRLPHLRPFRDGWRHAKYLFTAAVDRLLVATGLLFLLITTVLLVGLFMRGELSTPGVVPSPSSSIALVLGIFGIALLLSGSALLSTSGRIVPRTTLERLCERLMQSNVAKQLSITLLGMIVVFSLVLVATNHGLGLSFESQLAVQLSLWLMGATCLIYLTCRLFCEHCRLYSTLPRPVHGHRAIDEHSDPGHLHSMKPSRENCRYGSSG